MSRRKKKLEESQGDPRTGRRIRTRGDVWLMKTHRVMPCLLQGCTKTITLFSFLSPKDGLVGSRGHHLRLEPMERAMATPWRWPPGQFRTGIRAEETDRKRRSARARRQRKEGQAETEEEGRGTEARNKREGRRGGRGMSRRQAKGIRGGEPTGEGEWEQRERGEKTREEQERAAET